MSDTPPPKRRHPIFSEEALKDLALNYALRFPGTTEAMRRYLTKKMREAVAAQEAPPSAIRTWVDQVIATLTRVQILDDARYAEARARSLHRRGKSSSLIARDLKLKGADGEASAHAIQELREAHPHADLAAAITLAQRKRLGPFRTTPLPSAFDARQKQITKELGALARNGFSFEIARKVVHASDAQTLLEALEDD